MTESEFLSGLLTSFQESNSLCEGVIHALHAEMHRFVKQGERYEEAGKIRDLMRFLENNVREKIDVEEDANCASE